MRRREFIALIGGASFGLPHAVRAQQPAPVIGFLSSLSSQESSYLADAFRRGLAEGGFVEGQNIVIEYRWAEGRSDQLPAMATDLAGRNVALLVSSGGAGTLLAAKAATATIPIVFITGVDPVKAGIIASLNRPGGNLTGVHVLTTGLESKRFGLLQEIVPATSRTIVVLSNPNNPNTAGQLTAVEDAARTASRPIRLLYAGSETDLESAFTAMDELKPGALLVASDPWLYTRRSRLIKLAARSAIPAIYQWREFADAGGLMSYGTNLGEAYRSAGTYAWRILKGAKPAELPVAQPTKFELVINLKTAKTLGVQIPAALLAIADDVIE